MRIVRSLELDLHTHRAASPRGDVVLRLHNIQSDGKRPISGRWIRVWYEQTSYAVTIANGNLDMAVAPYPASLVKTLTLGEHTSHGVKGLDGTLISRQGIQHAMQMSNNRAIQVSKDKVRVRLTRHAFIHGDGQSRLPLDSDESPVGIMKNFQIFTRQEIKAIAKIDYGADYVG